MAALRRQLSFLLALVGCVAASIALLAGTFVGLLARCDEACDGHGWRHSAGSWQWGGVAMLGALAFVGAVALAIFVWRQRPGRAFVSYVVAFGAVVALASAVSPGWTDHLDRRSQGQLLFFLVGVGAPLAAVILSWAQD